MSTVAQNLIDIRSAFDDRITKPLSWRLKQLDALNRMLVLHGSEFEQAMTEDLGRNATESYLSEIGFVKGEIKIMRRHLRRWLKPQRVGTPVAVAPARAYTVLEPLGAVLIISPWNYPLQLLLAPFVGALAAGNAILLKPSELAPATSAALARLIPRYLDSRAIRVVEGGVEETTELLAQRWDHIFYTGNATVGRIVAQAAAQHLTPITLELGGKSPVYVDDSTNIPVAAARIAWAKFINAGQTCVAPDYILATESVRDRLADALKDAVQSFYGEDPETSADYSRIVNDRHFDRLRALLGSGQVGFGGQVTPDSRYIAPTVLVNVPRDSPVMEQEIFGPILPIITVTNLDDALGFINSGEKPLSLYVFSESKVVRRRFVTETSSGAIGFGVAAAHVAVPGLPFGGVGESGMGSYHGKRSLLTFSHEKPVLAKGLVPETMKLLYPPYTKNKDKIVRTLG